MKKVLLLAAIFCGSLAFTSCSKSECECVIAGTTIKEEASSSECDEADTVAKTAGGSCKMV
ncbi:hypothetical protein N9242_07760 [Vicingaceae bacterium]|jgi:hypothetical protein|nr:hypothetical protein [Vicingaceae bacterium]